MIAVPIVLGLIVGVFWLRRRGKRRLVAGLVAERPMFQVAPPSPRVHKRKQELL